VSQDSTGLGSVMAVILPLARSGSCQTKYPG
jgi:hypothetical protein